MKVNLRPSILEVKTTSFFKEIEVPYSKSWANRILILAAIKNSPVTIKAIPDSSDVLNLIASLKKIGLIIEDVDHCLVVKNSFPECERGEEVIYLETGDGGTTNRFILPLLARGSKKYRLVADGHMKDRPMEEIIVGLQSLGVHIVKGGAQDDFWIEVQGPLKKTAQKLEIDCTRSTQFASGLSLALADCPEIKIIPKNVSSSEKYLEMTYALIEKFRKGELEYVVPVDFSGLSYPLALAATLGEVTITNCHAVDKLQADSIFLKILTEMGAEVSFEKKGLKVKQNKNLSAIDINCSGFPDLVPTLAYVCSYAKGESTLDYIDVLRHKESDRVDEILKLLTIFSIPHRLEKSDREKLIIEGCKDKQSTPWAEIMPAADHRMVMSAYLFCRKNNGGKIHNACHVKKSFSNFFELLE